jgi:hypothetical protein
MLPSCPTLLLGRDLLSKFHFTFSFRPPSTTPDHP